MDFQDYKKIFFNPLHPVDNSDASWSAKFNPRRSQRVTDFLFCGSPCPPWLKDFKNSCLEKMDRIYMIFQDE